MVISFREVAIIVSVHPNNLMDLQDFQLEIVWPKIRPTKSIIVMLAKIVVAMIRNYLLVNRTCILHTKLVNAREQREFLPLIMRTNKMKIMKTMRTITMKTMNKYHSWLFLNILSSYHLQIVILENSWFFACPLPE